jgi:hypothetical protein
MMHVNGYRISPDDATLGLPWLAPKAEAMGGSGEFIVTGSLYFI